MSDSNDLSGLWEGNFRYSSAEEIGNWPFKAKIVVKDGRLTGLVLEPRTSGSGEARAEIVGTVEGQNVQFSKRYLQERFGYKEVVQYEGQLSPEGNSIHGSWKLPDDKGEFEMTLVR